MDGEGYMDFMIICIFKFKCDGGFIVVNEFQVINIVNVWYQDDSVVQVFIRLFNVDKLDFDDNYQVLLLVYLILKFYVCWLWY